ncbi:hypothetical protein ACNOYE_09130 [Nannocystaceae bacterium ST9]
MTPSETVESLLFRTGERFDQVDRTTWVLQLGNRRRSRVFVMIEEPIVLLTVPLASVDETTPARERLFQTLLELNADLLRSAYALEQANGEDDRAQQVVLSAALQIDRLDITELLAVLDDMTMALDTHLDKLSEWKLDTTPSAET